jgi:MYXO-CTERM domain-containing protein
VSRLALGLIVLAGSTALAEGSAEAAPTYVRSTVSAPWGSTDNEQAMDMVFGVGGWDDLRYETLDPAVLLTPATSFVYLEGSDSNALELAAWLMANQAALEAWVNAGGTLFLNAAPNEGGNMAWGFGGVTLHYPDTSADPGTAVDPAHPIWNGPFLPTALMWTGSSYAHASVSGPGLIPLIIDANGGNPNMSELAGPGAGRVIFGGLTTSNFWTPAVESLNLRANIIAYLAAGDGDIDGLDDFADNCPAIFNPLQEDLDMDGLGDVCDVCVDDPGNDLDGDLICAADDNCPDDSNPLQENADADDLGDACDPCPGDVGNDPDEDEICAAIDNCPMSYNPAQIDQDMDGVGAVCDICPLDADDDGDVDGLCADEDNCPTDTNPLQEDADMDGVGDLCDSCPDDDDTVADIDADGICAARDNCPDDANVGQEDGDSDGLGDACDACPDDANNDVDLDGVCGDVDNCPDDPNEDQADADGDGVGDACMAAPGTDDGGMSTTGLDGTGGTDGDGGPAATTGLPTGGDESGDSTGGDGGQDTSSGGCNCRTSDPQRERATAWWLLPLAGFLRRRRRPLVSRR